MCYSLRTLLILLVVVVAIVLGGLTIPMTAQSAAGNRRQPEMTTWSSGMVRDEAERPIVGAKIYPRATYYGDIRMNGLSPTAITDVTGQYLIEREDKLSTFSALLIAHVPGCPPALAGIAPPVSRWGGLDFGSDVPRLPTSAIDFVIPSRGKSRCFLQDLSTCPACENDSSLRIRQ